MTHVNEKMWKIIIYFLILSMINLFPMNYLVVKEQGWRLNFVEESFTLETPDWVLPESCSITASKLMCSTLTEYTYEHQGITYIFNYQGTEYDLTKKQLLFKENQIIYTNGENASMVGYDYRGFSDTQSFLELNLSEGIDRQELYIQFGQSIESTFGPYIVLYTLLVNSITSIGMNMLLLLILSLVLQLFRFGYSKFFTYKDSLKFLVYMMGVPALLSFIVGLVEPAFSPVFFQLGMGISTMIVMLVYGKRYFA
ncbi:MAG: DUF1189 domain-containing protein [Firmicutes bacterium]|nr:DUF1189 domain-containing protein [Bacillota bacterium]